MCKMGIRGRVVISSRGFLRRVHGLTTFNFCKSCEPEDAKGPINHREYCYFWKFVKFSRIFTKKHWVSRNVDIPNCFNDFCAPEMKIFTEFLNFLMKIYENPEILIFPMGYLCVWRSSLQKFCNFYEKLIHFWEMLILPMVLNCFLGSRNDKIYDFVTFFAEI